MSTNPTQMLILILGTAGINQQNGSITSAEYLNSTDHPIKSNSYINSTDALLQNFKDSEVVFIGTQKSYDVQTKILKDPRIQNRTDSTHKTVDDKSLDEVFSKVLETISESKSQEIIIDLTHGYRHQPIVGSFSAFISSILQRDKNIRLIFAKEEEPHKKYEYVSLDSYIDSATLSYTLISFVQTFTTPSTNSQNPLITSLKSFSQDLFANNIHSLYGHSLPELKSSITLSKKEKSLSYLGGIFDELEEIAELFDGAKSDNSYIFYYNLSKIMFDKKYFLIASTYLYEAILEYLLFHFERLEIIKSTDESHYAKTQAVANYCQSESIHKLIKPPSDYFYCSNIEIFTPISALISNIREIRNNTAHLSQNYQNRELRKAIEEMLDSFDKYFLQKDILKNLTNEQKKESKPCLQSKSLFAKKMASYFDKKLGLKLSQTDLESAYRNLQKIVSDIDKSTLSKEDKKALKKYCAENGELLDLILKAYKGNDTSLFERVYGHI